MAIIIEEEKKKNGNILVMFGWFAIAVMVLIAAYYLVFASSEAVIVTPPANFAGLQPIAQITVLPQDVIGLSSFKLLSSSAAQPIVSSTIAAGRPNPFVAP
jgi:hypothetical protein